MRYALRIAFTIAAVVGCLQVEGKKPKTDAAAIVHQSYLAAIDSACTNYANYDHARAVQWLEMARGAAYDTASAMIVKCLEVNALVAMGDSRNWRDSLEYATRYMMQRHTDTVSIYGCGVANWMIGWLDLSQNIAGSEKYFEDAGQHFRVLNRDMLADYCELMESEALLAQSRLVESNDLARRMVERSTRTGNKGMRFFALMQLYSAYTTLNMLDMAEQIDNTIATDGWYKATVYSELRYIRQRGHFLLSSGRYDEAETYIPRMEVLQELVNRPTETWRTQLLISKLLLYQGKMNEAEKHIKACEQILPRLRVNPYNNYHSPYHLPMMQAYIALHRGDVRKAKELIDRVKVPALQNDAHDFIEPYYEILEQISIAQGNYRDAIYFLRQRNEKNDSLLRNNINQRTRDLELSYANDSTIVKQHAELYAQQNDIADKRLQMVLSVLLVVLLCATAVMLHTIWLRRRNNAGAKEEAERHLMLEQEVRQQTQELKRQNDMLGEENLDNLRSHAYAKHIQQGILPPPTMLNTYLGTEGSFVLFQPKGLISGDFYWFKRLSSGKVVTCCADSWGSDAQGAMMSAASIMVLNDAIPDDDDSTAAGILKSFNDKLLSMLPDINTLEGVTCTVAVIDTEAQTINMSMARQKAVFSHSGQQMVLRGINRKIGEVAHPFVDREYEDIVMNYTHGDTLYLMTDGVTSLFGGTKGEKLKMSGLIDIIREAEKETPDKRQIAIRRLMAHWAGNYPKSDDITLIGLSL